MLNGSVRPSKQLFTPDAELRRAKPKQKIPRSDRSVRPSKQLFRHTPEAELRRAKQKQKKRPPREKTYWDLFMELFGSCVDNDMAQQEAKNWLKEEDERQRVYVFGLDVKSRGALQLYDAANDSWSSTLVKSNEFGKFNHSMLAACGKGDDKVYFTKGLIPDFFMYDVTNHELRQLVDLPYLAEYCSGAVLDQQFYLVGGRWTDDKTPVLDVERYDPHEDMWSPVAELLQPHYWPALATLKGCLYVIGSYLTADVWSPFCQRYDPDSNKWKTVAYIPDQLDCRMSVTAHGGKLYGIQERSLRKVYVYTEERDEWEMIESDGVVPPIHSAQLVSSSGHLLAFDKRCTVFEYHPKKARWERGTDNPGELKFAWNVVATWRNVT